MCPGNALIYATVEIGKFEALPLSPSFWNCVEILFAVAAGIASDFFTYQETKPATVFN